MKERPILFSGPMVRALLAGTKTQTRRIVKTFRHTFPGVGERDAIKDTDGLPSCVSMLDAGTDLCPYGMTGDRLWVKETFSAHGAFSDRGRIAYRADVADGKEPHGLHWKPSIFCTRAASRITLDIVSVRVERLNDISEADALAEGIDVSKCPITSQQQAFAERRACSVDYVAGYRALWESINGPGSWAANPFVWVITFKKIAS